MGVSRRADAGKRARAGRPSGGRAPGGGARGPRGIPAGRRATRAGALVPRVLVLAGALALVLLAGPAGATSLKTDATKALVPLEEIISGGPPPDGIPAIDRPVFVAFAAADRWLGAREPVLALEVGGEARAYPLQILMWHEIVNDTVGGRPVVATYCPLCNSGLVYDRVVDGRPLDFGTSGMLYKSDLVMYDRQTHSLWAQMEGRAIVGARAGARLASLPANTIAYGEFKAIYPRGVVLSRETGHARAYGKNPYAGYDQPDSPPFLFRGPLDARRPPKERVVGVVVAGVARAYPWPAVAKRGVVHDTIEGERLVVLHRPGALSALDASTIADSRAIGATAVFSPVVDGAALTLEPTPDGFRDRQTGSAWTLLGHAVRGPLAGKRLRPIAHVDAFWFAWAAFHPSTALWAPP